MSTSDPRPRLSLRVLIGVALSIAVAISGALPALAADPQQSTFLPDPNDTPGKLDVREVRHGPLLNLPRGWTVETFARWTAKQIWDTGFVLVFLDTIGTPADDYYALVRSTGRGLAGSLWRDDHRDRQIGKLKVSRANRREVTVVVPFRKLKIGDSRTTYRWRVLTIFKSDACSRNCFDRAPNSGSVEEVL